MGEGDSRESGKERGGAVGEVNTSTEKEKCLSIVAKGLCPAAVFKLCPPGVSMVIGVRIGVLQ